jgi:hypothetical protein
MNRQTKLPEWVVEVLAMDAERGEVIRVTVTGDQPKVSQGGYDGSDWPHHDGLIWPHLSVVVAAGMVVSA